MHHHLGRLLFTGIAFIPTPEQKERGNFEQHTRQNHIIYRISIWIIWCRLFCCPWINRLSLRRCQCCVNLFISGTRLRHIRRRLHVNGSGEWLCLHLNFHLLLVEINAVHPPTLNVLMFLAFLRLRLSRQQTHRILAYTKRTKINR